MKIIINNSSMQPIYEQIVTQVRALILQGSLADGDALPSVRALAKELKISALTVKKAYDALEAEGLVMTVHGKGSFISAANQSFFEEMWHREVETGLEQVVEKGRSYGMTDEELRQLFELVMEE